MSIDIINLKVDAKTKKEAQRIAEALGFSLSGIMKGFLRQLIYTKAINFSLPEEPSEWAQKKLKKSEDDYNSGQYIEFKTPKEALRHIDQLIERDERKASPKN